MSGQIWGRNNGRMTCSLTDSTSNRIYSADVEKRRRARRGEQSRPPKKSLSRFPPRFLRTPRSKSLSRITFMGSGKTSVYDPRMNSSNCSNMYKQHPSKTAIFTLVSDGQQRWPLEPLARAAHQSFYESRL